MKMIVKLVSALMSVLVCIQICSLAGNRATLFWNMKRKYEDQRENDIYTANTICHNEEIRRGMGEMNSRMCQELEERINLNPKVAAVLDVLEQTHLCGDSTCTAYIKDVMRFILNDWRTSVIVSVVVIFTIQCSGCFGFNLNFLRGRGNHRGRAPFTTRDNICIRAINNDLPFDRLPYNQQYFYSTNQIE